MNGLVCQVDGAWKENVGWAGAGWSLSDEREVQISQPAKSLKCVSPLQAEAHALRHALECAVRKGLTSLTIHTYSITLKNHFFDEVDWEAQIFNIMLDIKYLASSISCI